MSINMNDDENIPADTEACYETVASQEEIYLEETEEELRAILICEDPSQTTVEVWQSTRGEQEVDIEVASLVTEANNDSCKTESLDEQLNEAAEELITGDSDDPPLSEDAVVDMLKMPRS